VLGLLPAVGTLNCFSFPTGAPSAAVPNDKANPPATTAANTLRSRFDMHPSLNMTAPLWWADTNTYGSTSIPVDANWR
jgi:hypothetical protein